MLQLEAYIVATLNCHLLAFFLGDDVETFTETDETRHPNYSSRSFRVLRVVFFPVSSIFRVDLLALVA